ncbi:hypothetical protein jhhlp_007561 [Lomentospora prolificans]|uniref:BZIP domain-containing protein n=1 Tax=Lomentospora prolificans TaxID=41688 RepID=A0A2N3MZZ5_9PEZI|nr:hypothetical protein jhhlp_007561 [Lomentospora prolificans]
MSPPIESDTATSSQRNREVSTVAGVYCSRRASDSGVTTRRRGKDAFGKKAYGQRSKAKLQKLQEKVKVHQQFVEESAKNQLGSTALPPTAAATPPSSMFPASEYTYFSALAPPGDLDTDCTPYTTRALDQGAFLNPLQPPATFAHATPFDSWNTFHGSYDSQKPLTPEPSCPASGMLMGVSIDGPFCSAQSLRDLHADRGAWEPLTPEPATVVPGDSRRHVDTPVSLQGRVRHVMEQAAVVGFETLDEAIAAYYTETFEDVPSLYQEQRLSRNRRLPRLLNTLHSASNGWSEWERRGFQEQLTLGAEKVLIQELNTFITQQRVGADGNKSANADMRDTSIGSTEDVMMRTLKAQNDVSATFDPMRTLSSHAGTDPFGQENRSDTVLAIIETLCHGQGSSLKGCQDRS